MLPFSLDDSIGYTFNTVANLLKRELNEAFRQAGIDILAEQWALLFRLREQPGMNQQELAQSVSRDNASVTRSLLVLEKKRLVERRQSDADRRNRYLYLTSEGEQLLPQLIQCAQQVLQKALHGISDREIDFLNGLVRQMIVNLTK
ncbi:MarR family winged helix-turn-helix transcriptional regulator [Larkinella soli]|uniref:MarR family winged helix-turn-helix transcriptional regulator n=1 Tax=Larkinella soli TaxID=1770527 RepID=UPI000FFB58B3|nr:MarR family transcriptional regulator [Larkinella soli]